LNPEFSEVPVVFYTYYNPVFSNGIDAYVQAAKAAGVDGMLVLDLPPEEGAEFAAAARAHGIDSVCIVAPTTPDARIAKIAAAATGFIYYVSREGVTGVRSEVAGGIPEAVARIRAHTDLPIAVGFGIGTRAQVAQVAAAADGVVVGSALVNIIKDNLTARAMHCPGTGGQGRGLGGGHPEVTAKLRGFCRVEVKTICLRRGTERFVPPCGKSLRSMMTGFSSGSQRLIFETSSPRPTSSSGRRPTRMGWPVCWLVATRPACSTDQLGPRGRLAVDP